MTQPGPAQMDLIRRYARTLRELHADAVRTRPQRSTGRFARVADTDAAKAATDARGTGTRPVPSA